MKFARDDFNFSAAGASGSANGLDDRVLARSTAKALNGIAPSHRPPPTDRATLSTDYARSRECHDR
jgi:hypothetical protein